MFFQSDSHISSKPYKSPCAEPLCTSTPHPVAYDEQPEQALAHHGQVIHLGKNTKRESILFF